VLLHVDNEQLNEKICRRMKEMGCEIIYDIP
jgi:hypothetical protein